MQTILVFSCWCCLFSGGLAHRSRAASSSSSWACWSSLSSKVASPVGMSAGGGRRFAPSAGVEKKRWFSAVPAETAVEESSDDFMQGANRWGVGRLFLFFVLVRGFCSLLLVLVLVLVLLALFKIFNLIMMVLLFTTG